jgi:hypothetical protein
MSESASGCRLCGDSLAQARRMRIADAPSGAQHFADTEAEARARSIALTIAECGSCGLVQSLSPAVEGHRRAITAAGVSGPMRDHRVAQARRLSAVLNTANARVALIGCGNGYELALLAEAGFRPEGIEWGGAPPAYDGTWPVHDGYPERGTPLPGAPYVAFACYNFLEHAADPRGFLVAIRESLAQGGAGVVEVPNYTRQRTERRAADYIADHLSYFDARTFRALLLVSGFDVVTLDEVRGGENLEAIVRVPQDANLAGDEQDLATARAAVAGFFARWSAQGGGAVAWGASHQAMTLYGGLPSDQRPRAILDSASFKRGKFAPPSGIAVVAPSREALGAAGAVLVVASGYEREITRALRHDLGFVGEIWSVRGHELHRLD